MKNQGLIDIFSRDVWLLAVHSRNQKTNTDEISLPFIFSSFRIQFCHHNLVHFRFLLLVSVSIYNVFASFPKYYEGKPCAEDMGFLCYFLQGSFYGPRKTSFNFIPLTHRHPNSENNIYRIFTEVIYINSRRWIIEGKWFSVDWVLDEPNCCVGIITVTNTSCEIKPSDRINYVICDICCKDLLIVNADKNSIICPYKGGDYAYICDIVLDFIYFYLISNFYWFFYQQEDTRIQITHNVLTCKTEDNTSNSPCQ